MNMSRKLTLTEFLESKNPYVIFLTHNIIKVDAEEFERFNGFVKLDDSVKELFEDL